MKKYLILWLLAFSSLQIHAQTDSLKTPTIFLTGKNTGKEVILRWAPETPGVWTLSNAHGYQLDRMEFSSQQDFLEAGYQPLSNTPIKPWPMEKWRQPALENDYAALAAEILYGESDYSPDIFRKAEQFKNLLGSALMAAEFSSVAAEGLGLRYVDTDINPDKKYLYRLYSLGASSDYPIDTAYLMISGNEIDANPAVDIAEVKEREGHIEIWWDRAAHEKLFSGYYIEKSTNKKNFQRINQAPFVSSPLPGSSISKSYIIFTDSVENYQPHYYRIIGINTFGEQAPVSKVIKAMGRDRTPPPPPINAKAEQIAPGKMKISWEISGDDKNIKGFLIARGHNPEVKPVTITTEPLKPKARSFIDETYDELQNNWYFIGVMDTANNANVTLPIYGNVVDTIPPAVPANIKGKIDTTGVVTLSWNLNRERDLQGYAIFFTNQNDHVYARVNQQVFQDTVFYDTLSVNVLTEEIYYKVVAIDANFNHSDFSNPIKLMKPDVVPPVAPVFTNYKVSEKGISLTWAQSSSADVNNHMLYRKLSDTDAWQVVFKTDSIKRYQSYLDTNLTLNESYNYKIIAVDDAGLSSDVSYELTLRAIDFKERPAVKKFNAKLSGKETKQVDLSWAYPVEGDFYFRIYRAVDGGGFSPLDKIQKGQLSFKDQEVRANKKYEYAIKVVYKDGKESGFGPIASVTIN
ncbi:fibronectin type III domain-containing protein [Fulvivirga ligni]|uniref:fibronectin type III domain-containing protein n=1 Tax=Fulvivirga ligni TaxID=2904246 RepID=UPI001F25C983|nr:hypothetical protein [Fulvivirga ligni]UII22906.1 hypothetical protein LVD16_06680 [Fulvivirga ligni]